ncbi:hypothetical protein ACSBR2_028881 [Camellia fascicularis]
MFYAIGMHVQCNSIKYTFYAQSIVQNITNDVPLDGASPEIPPQLSPEMEVEPEPVLLPPRVRSFDPTTYDPQTYVLPPESVWHFRGFERSAPEDLLLRELASHLSCGATENSHSIKGYGATSTREWYMELPDGVRHIVDEAGFGLFCMGLSRLIASQPVLGALVERWWDTTNSFHFSTVGEITMTPYDFSMLTGIEVGGCLIPYDTDMGEWETAWIYLLGAHPHLFRSRMVQYSWFAEQFRGREPAVLRERARDPRGDRALRPRLLDVPLRHHFVRRQSEHCWVISPECSGELVSGAGTRSAATGELGRYALSFCFAFSCRAFCFALVLSVLHILLSALTLIRYCV